MLQRVGFGPDAMAVRQALNAATLGCARVLDRDDTSCYATQRRCHAIHNHMR